MDLCQYRVKTLRWPVAGDLRFYGITVIIIANTAQHAPAVEEQTKLLTSLHRVMLEITTNYKQTNKRSRQKNSGEKNTRD